MKKLFLLITFYFLLFTSFSQIQFNTISVNEESVISNNVFLLEDTGYVTMGQLIENGKRRYFVSQFDVNGSIQTSEIYGYGEWDFYTGYEGNCVKTNDSCYAFTGMARIGDAFGTDSIFVYLTIFDSNLDSLWSKSYLNDTVYLEVIGINKTKDKGFLIVGKTSRKENGNLTYENTTDAFMLKIDSLGEQEWYRTFGRNLSSHDQDEFDKVVQTPDGGYLCAGYTKSWQNHITSIYDKGDWWLVKTDSLGIEQWSRQYGHPDFSDGRPFGLLMSSDTSYYIIGANTLYQINENDVTNSHILKLDKNFNEVYQKNFGGISRKNCFFSIIENNENDLVLTGYFQDAYEIYNERATMYKLTVDGDSIWKRQYVSTDTTDCINYAYSLAQTQDNGYIFTGIAYDYGNSPAQQIWLVKTDEYGCDGTNWWTCATNIGVNEYVRNPNFELYPNPATNDIQLTISNVQLGESVEIQIYDLTGKLVKQFKIQNSELKIQISDLKKGVYIVRVGKQTKKLIVE